MWFCAITGQRVYTPSHQSLIDDATSQKAVSHIVLQANIAQTLLISGRQNAFAISQRTHTHNHLFAQYHLLCMKRGGSQHDQLIARWSLCVCMCVSPIMWLCFKPNLSSRAWSEHWSSCWMIAYWGAQYLCPNHNNTSYGEYFAIPTESAIAVQTHI